MISVITITSFLALHAKVQQTCTTGLCVIGGRSIVKMVIYHVVMQGHLSASLIILINPVGITVVCHAQRTRLRKLANLTSPARIFS
jgi:predicted alpha/beta-hydrolase family hydrolase